ncbi:glycosyltransferase family 2 protein [Candidatus Woesearchaeota archaeon]|nr:glycosyltransferase family 2 protein [Candidatus Woesearchaeota archaeon]
MRVLSIIPAYNEEATIARIVKETTKFTPVLVIDDCSSDNTAQTARQAGCETLRNERNQGKGFSLRTGFAYAIKNNYDAVITLDADGEHKPEEIPRFIEALQQADLIVGQRNVQRSKSRTFLNWFSTFFMRYVLPDLDDTQCGYRAIKTDLLKKMNFTTDRFDLELEMLLEATKHQARIAGLPLQHRPIAKSHQTTKDYVRINNLFDKWCLRNMHHLTLPLHTKAFLYVSCSVGIAIGTLAEKLT